MNKGIKSIFLSFLFLLCCVDEEISSPTVETVGVETFTTNTATLKGSLLKLGTFPVTGVGFRYSDDSLAVLNAPVFSSLDLKSGSEGPFSAEINGLESRTKYFFQATASTKEENVYGEIKSFSTR